MTGSKLVVWLRRYRQINMPTALVVAGAITVSVIVASILFIRAEAVRETRSTRAQTIVNEVEVLEHRIRQEESHDCQTRYLREVVTAFAARQDPRTIEPCPAVDVERLKAALAEARRRLPEVNGKHLRGAKLSVARPT